MYMYILFTTYCQCVDNSVLYTYCQYVDNSVCTCTFSLLHIVSVDNSVLYNSCTCTFSLLHIVSMLTILYYTHVHVHVHSLYYILSVC